MSKFFYKYGKYFVYAFALLVVALNFSLMFDNVVWGDEAYTVITSKCNVAGILQRTYFLDSHPPFYYIWCSFISAPFGHSIPGMHLASLLPFTAGIVLAVTYLRKKLGDFSAICFIILSGLAFPCCEYNLEIRMYALVFLCLLVCATMSIVIFDKNKGILPWVVMVLVGVIAAYSHYYGLVSSGLLLFMTGLMYFIRNKKFTWAYGVISCVSYLVLYSPWMFVLLKQMKDVKGSWWATEVPGVFKLFTVIFCGDRIKWILIPVVIFLFVFVLCTERKKTKTIAFYGIITFISTACLVITFGYVVSKLLNPIMELRYMYPLVPLTLMTLMLGIWKFTTYKDSKAIKISVVVFLIIILGLGLWDFRDYRSTVKEQERVTKETLAIIGEPEEGTVFMATEVQHLSFTVLQSYYPGFEVLGLNGGNTLEIDENAKSIWRFSLSGEPDYVIEEMERRGYTYEYLGEGHMAKYNFLWCHYYK